jgi:hypothetical protein
MKKVLKSIGRAALIILGGITFGVSLTAILHNLNTQWAIVSLLCILIAMVAFIDYKINN